MPLLQSSINNTGTGQRKLGSKD